MRRRKEPFESYVKMIWALAHQYALVASPTDNAYRAQLVEELFAEGCLAYSLCEQEYNSDKGMFSTFLYICAQNQMRGYLSNEHRKLVERYQEMPAHYEPAGDAMIDRIAALKQMVNGLSKESQLIIRAALSMRSEQRKGGTHPVLSRIVKALKSAGWTHYKIRKHCSEIRLGLSSI